MIGWIFFIIVAVAHAGCAVSDNDKTESTDEARKVESVTNPHLDSSVNTEASAKVTTVLRSVEDLKQMSRKRCARYYTLDCLKVDMISFVDRMGRNTNLNVYSGIMITSDLDRYVSSERSFSAKSLQSFALDSDSSQLDSLLLHKLKNYIKSLTLNIQLFEGKERAGKSLASNLLDSVIRTFEGRASKKAPPLGGKLSGALQTMAMVAGGALLWLGLSTFAAIATKALVTAFISLVITCFTAYKTSGSSGHKSTTYEIVARPMYTHGHAAAAPAEIQADPHSAATGVGYGRNMEWDKSSNVRTEILQIPLRNEDAVHDMVYRAHVRPIYKRGAAIPKTDTS